ncbi:hypothetical protein [Actinophytocola sp.]|uniref:hypothetical protein n=1 Tax=Actinophytocola sp. TaxID=1872138 RepID=UPI003D6A109B
MNRIRDVRAFAQIEIQADYLSTLGLEYLVGNCAGLVDQFNEFIERNTKQVDVRT